MKKQNPFKSVYHQANKILTPINICYKDVLLFCCDLNGKKLVVINEEEGELKGYAEKAAEYANAKTGESTSGGRGGFAMRNKLVVFDGLKFVPAAGYTKADFDKLKK